MRFVNCIHLAEVSWSPEQNSSTPDPFLAERSGYLKLLPPLFLSPTPFTNSFLDLSRPSPYSLLPPSLTPPNIPCRVGNARITCREAV